MSVESALLGAFAERLGPVTRVSHSVRDWHSAVFSGTRHVFRIGHEAGCDVAAFAGQIAEADIALPRGFVADVAVTPEPSGIPHRLDVEVLVLDA